MKKKYDWSIHLLANWVICENCGETEEPFLKHACNAHTHGMEKYGHMDFQMVLEYPPQHICYILNTLGERVRDGKQFHVGELVEGIFLDCLVRLDEFEEDGRKVLRVIIPDRYNLFPEDPKCMDMYRLQLLPTDALYKSAENITGENPVKKSVRYWLNTE